MKKLLILMLISLFGMANEVYANAAGPDDGPQKCGDTLQKCSYVMDSNNTLVISGTGSITKTQEGNYYLSYTAGNAKKVIVEEGITNIDKLSSVGNTSGGATELYIPESVKKIGNDAFKSFDVANIIIAGEDTEISSQALSNLTAPFEMGGLPYTRVYTAKISCVKGSKTEERLKAIIGNYPNITLSYIGEESESQSKAKRTYYTIEEALQHVNHTNNNKIIFTFK